MKDPPVTAVLTVSPGIELVVTTDRTWGLRTNTVRTDKDADRALESAYLLTQDSPSPEEMLDRLAQLLTTFGRSCAACPCCSGTGTNRVHHRCGLCASGLVFAELVPRRLVEATMPKHVLFAAERVPR